MSTTASPARSRPTLPRLLTATEVAEQTGLPLSSVYELTRRDMIPHVKLGRAYRYSAPAVAEWIEAGGAADDDGATDES